MNEKARARRPANTRHTQNPTEYRRCMAMHIHEDFRRDSISFDVIKVECRLREILMNSFIDAKNTSFQHSLDELVYSILEQVDDEALKRVQLQMLNEAYQNIKKELIG